MYTHSIYFHRWVDDDRTVIKFQLVTNSFPFYKQYSID